MADELSDAEVFGAQPQKQELSDADVFGSQPASAPPGQQQAQYVRQLAAEPAAVQELTQQFDQAHPVVAGAVNAIGEQISGLVPKSLQQAAELATPAVSGAEQAYQAAKNLYDVAIGGKSISEVSPQGRSFSEFTPYEWGQFGGTLAGQLAMAALIGHSMIPKGGGLAPVTESVVRSELERPPVQTAREPVPQNLQPKVEPYPSLLQSAEDARRAELSKPVSPEEMGATIGKNWRSTPQGGEQTNAIEPSNAQVETGQTAQRLQEGAGSNVPEAGNRNNVIGETQGATARGEIPARTGTEAQPQVAKSVENAQALGNIQELSGKPRQIPDQVGKATEAVLEPPGSVLAKLSFGNEVKVGEVPSFTSRTTSRGKQYNFSLSEYDLPDGRKRFIISAGGDLVDAAALVKLTPEGPEIQMLHAGKTGFEGLGGALAKEITKRYGKPIVPEGAPLSTATKRFENKPSPVPEGQQAPAVSEQPKTVSPEASAATKPTAAIPAEAPAPTGISEARTEAELGKGSVEPGVGAELGSGLEFGRKYINEGKDPRLPIRRAQASGMVGVNEVGVVHAELERLRGERSAAARALEADPTNPELQRNFEQADNAQRAWRKELQPVLTKAGDALREAYAMSTPDADPATYQGLADLFDEHFKGKRDITPEMRTAMSRAAKGVQEARASANGEMAKVEQQLQKQMRGRKVMTPDELDADLKTVLENEFKDCILA